MASHRARRGRRRQADLAGRAPAVWRPPTGKPNASCIYPGDLSAWCADPCGARGCMSRCSTDRPLRGRAVLPGGGPGIHRPRRRCGRTSSSRGSGGAAILVMVDQRARADRGARPDRAAPGCRSRHGISRPLLRAPASTRLDDERRGRRPRRRCAEHSATGGSTSTGRRTVRPSRGCTQRHPASLRTMTLDSGPCRACASTGVGANAEHALDAVLARYRCPKVRGELSELLRRPPRRVLIETARYGWGRRRSRGP